MGRLRQFASGVRRVGGTALRQAGWATRADVNRLAAGTAELTARLDWLGQRGDAIEKREGWHIQRLTDLENRAAIEAVSRWIRHAKLSAYPTVSVVTPTRDRPERLERAIRSVVAQRYENWELFVVDDGEGDDGRAVVDALGDPRVSWSPNPRRGACAARNHALSLATGELIAYLDDDNIMDPEWLYAVAWAFEQRADIDVVYGAYVIDDYLRVKGDSSGALPWTFFYQWSRDALRRGNLADMGAIAHRAGLRGAWFDEGIREAEDWDLLVRLTAAKDPLMLPAVACYYTTDAPNRSTNGPTYRRNFATVLARAGGGRGDATSSLPGNRGAAGD